MNSHLSTCSTMYAAGRLALEYVNPYLPFLGENTYRVARKALLFLDSCDTLYVGWKIHEKLLKRENVQDKTPLYLDLAVKSAALIALGFLFVKGANHLLVPNVNLMDLLSKTAIPRSTIQVIAGESMDNLAAFWVKPFLENLNTGLFFIRTILDVYLAYITKQSAQEDKRDCYQLLLNAFIHAVTTFKTAQYTTIHVKHTFGKLFQKFSYTYSLEPSYLELSEKCFESPIKEVEATFMVNTRGFSREFLLEKIQSIYDYSKNMFEDSLWHRCFLWRGVEKGFFEHTLPSNDQAYTVAERSMASFNLVYQVFIAGDLPPPAPVKVRIFHTHTFSQPWQCADLFRLVPRFFIPPHDVTESRWIPVDLFVPLTLTDEYVNIITSYLPNPTAFVPRFIRQFLPEM